MTLFRLLAPVALCVTLGGCLMTRSDELRADADLCRSYGFRDGSQEMANCRMQRDQQRQALVGQIIANQNQPSRSATTCTTGPGYGNTVTTTCQ